MSLPRADVQGCVWLGWTVWRLRCGEQRGDCGGAVL